MKIFRTAVEPRNVQPLQRQTLNPSYRSAAPNFHATSNDGSLITSQDPRLYDTRRDIQTQLSDPPNQSRVDPFGDVYGHIAHAPKMSGNFYATYPDINTGQIRYYTSSGIEESVFKPLFTDTATTVSYTFTTPMGTVKPQYVRVPFVTTNPSTNPNGIPRKTLSFLEDTTAHREDILMHQMNTINSQKWTAKNAKVL